MKANTPNPIPTTLRGTIEEIVVCHDCGGYVSDHLGVQGDCNYEAGTEIVDQAAQSIQEQLKALLPKKINAEMPNTTTFAYNRCLSDVEKAIEEWAK